MSIPQSRYVQINSIIIGQEAVQDRELILRIFSSNELIPTSTLLEFTSSADVGDYFGTSSEEYQRAVFYFSFLSKTNIRPNKIGYFGWASSATAPRIYGNIQTQSIADWQAITDGSFSITLGSDSEEITSLDFSSVISLSDVSDIIQTAIRASNTNQVFTQSIVDFNASRSSFDFVGGEAGDFEISVGDASSGTAIIDLLGWSTGSIISSGSSQESITDILQISYEKSNNFGSFLFQDDISLENIEQAAQWNINPANENYQFFFSETVTKENSQLWYDTLNGYSGTVLTLEGPSGEYHDMLTPIILAATDYTQINSSQNYMYQFFSGITPTVYTSSDADYYDNLKINYYGQTQSNGAIQFYQRGYCFGGISDPDTQDVYANEMYLKRTISTGLMNLLLTSNKIPANPAGENKVRSVISSVCDNAILSGIILIDKTLTESQKSAILAIAGINNIRSISEVERQGYYLIVTSQPSDNLINYILIYSKGDYVRTITGTNYLV